MSESYGVNWYERVRKEGMIELASLDTGAAFEVDQSAILYDTSNQKFYVLFATGCSCWDGDADEWVFDSLDEVGKFLNDEALDAERYKCSLKGGIEMMAEAKEAFAKFQSVMG